MGRGRTDLTEPDDVRGRYVAAVLREVPAARREAAEREVRAVVAAAVAGHETEGAAAVRAALTELGDPTVLARRYGATPRFLIGPALYRTWARVLRALLAVLVPLVLVVVLVVNLWDADEGAAQAVLDALSAALETGVMVAFWVTVVFAILERTGAARRSERAEQDWSVDDLPPVRPRRQISAAEVVVSLVFLALLIGLLFWQRDHSPFFVDGRLQPVLEPSLWQAWIPALIALLAVMMGVEVWKYITGYWTLPLVLVNIALNATFAGVVVVLLRTRGIVNQAVVRAVEESTGAALPADAMTMAFALLIVVIAVWDSVDCVLKYLRARTAI